MSDISFAEAAALSGNNGFFGGNNGFIDCLLAWVIFSGGAFGGWGNRNANYATTEDLASGFNFSALQNKGNDILAAVNQEGRTTDGAICNLAMSTLEQAKDLGQQISDCCCGTQRAIDSVKFDMANYAAATNQAFSAGIQSVKDMFRDYQEQNLRDENMRNFVSSQLCGVMRWPMSATYAVSGNPLCGNAGCQGGTTF